MCHPHLSRLDHLILRVDCTIPAKILSTTSPAFLNLTSPEDRGGSPANHLLTAMASVCPCNDATRVSCPDRLLRGSFGGPNSQVPGARSRTTNGMALPLTIVSYLKTTPTLTQLSVQCPSSAGGSVKVIIKLPPSAAGSVPRKATSAIWHHLLSRARNRMPTRVLQNPPLLPITSVLQLLPALSAVCTGQHMQTQTHALRLIESRHSVRGNCGQRQISRIVFLPLDLRVGD